MGNGDGRPHSTKADTSRCSLEMRDSSRDCHPSRTSHAGPAAPSPRPCTSTSTLDPGASMLVQHRALLEPCPLSSHSSHPINDDGSITTKKWRRLAVASIQSSTPIRPPHHTSDPIHSSPIGTVLGLGNETISNQTGIATGTGAVCNAVKFKLVGPLFDHHNPSHYLENMNNRTTISVRSSRKR